MAFDPKTLTLYPEDPGVYLMKDEKGNVLYIGKAKNLKLRLRQYFAKSGDAREMIPYLTAQIEAIDTIIAFTEKDALILENNLIKQHKPKYNVLLKDDKTFVSLVITKHKWPMAKIIRFKGKSKSDGVYFGPYTNAFAARQTLDLILKLFPLRQCSDAELATRQRPCLLYDIKRCIAPCVDFCTKEEYDSHVQSAMRILKGKDKDVLDELRRKREIASERLEFEKAEEYHKMIGQIEHVTEKQHVEMAQAKNCDSIGLYAQDGAVMIALLLFREGKLTASEHFSFHLIAQTEEEIIETFLLQHYKNLSDPPKEIFVPLELTQRKAIEEIIQIEIHTPQKGKKKDLIKMASQNAKALFIKEQDAKSLKEKMLLEMQEALQLNRYPKRIECFDTSNISGTDPVASLVTFVDGEKEKSKMRLFKVKTQGDDYSAMKEVLNRHYTKEKEKGEFADLLIVDGGKGQLNIASGVFDDLKIASIDVIALTKEDARHDKGLTQEKIYVPHRKDPIFIDPRSPLLFLLQKIRDEAHKQAIQFHRKRRAKRTLSSELDDLEGIGPIKRKRLLQTFKSVKAIKEAKAEDLKKVQGITKKDLTTLLNWQKQ